ncbi:L,D-transpeptidase [Clostridium baratii]|uniref:ErfK/YbiS/YcfS/YnhG family protein n=1 Tax=Clostridium baratii TaxID=1561 RepID=A0A174UGM0_9CLOT|nr:L,D-transpeptidase [Clostridium baratii]CUQ19901.1 ErfK/YbiS/YcfS/YnhG family protein [Clostridium baratii]
MSYNIKNIKNENFKELNLIPREVKIKKKRKFNIPIIPITAFIIVLVFVLGFQAFSYKKLVSNFKGYFDSSNYAEANNYLVTEGNFNLFKALFLKNDLEGYFRTKANSIKEHVNLNELTPDEALLVMNEINRYNIITNSTDKSLSVTSDNITDNTPLAKGIIAFNKNNFEEALSIFNAIPSSDKNSGTALDYVVKCKEKIKESLLTTVKEKQSIEHFTEAINLIESKLSLLDNDKELASKVDELKKLREDYNKSNPSTSSAVESSAKIVSAINTENINTLGLQSSSNYLLYVDTNSQLTHIYKGSSNNWSLFKSLKCSTGKEGSETPSGVYTIKNRDTWFFSKKFNQGGKYWVQFDGDYLFHSLPFAEDQKTIVDYTLGEPASHGCIRLSLEDSKWLYDNIPTDTKLIIK